jgi:hypothetical protein
MIFYPTFAVVGSLFLLGLFDIVLRLRRGGRRFRVKGLLGRRERIAS